MHFKGISLTIFTKGVIIVLNEAYARYCAIEELLENDKELGALKQRLAEEAAALNRVLDRLSEEDRAVILEYLGLLAETEQRTVELSCFSQEA